jgi:nucleotide-binding universal stress UspA family protein
MRPFIKRILIPTDFSEIAQNTVLFILSLTKGRDTEVFLLHTEEENVEKDETKSYTKEDVIRATSSYPNVNIKFIVVNAPFDNETINEVVEENQIDILLLGTDEDNSGIPKILLGTGAFGIIENSRIPVLTVPSGCKYAGISRIAYSTDLINVEKEMNPVFEFAKFFNATVNIFHVTPIFPDVCDVEKRDVPKIVDEIKAKLEYSKINYFVERTRYENQITKGIDLFLNQDNPDLLIMFYNRRSWFDKVFTPSPLANIISHLSIPLLTFPKKNLTSTI